jgi:hypothetical protein
MPKCTPAETKDKDRQTERIALTVFPIGELVLENTLERVISSLFDTISTTKDDRWPRLPEKIG